MIVIMLKSKYQIMIHQAIEKYYFYISQSLYCIVMYFAPTIKIKHLNNHFTRHLEREK